MNSITVAGNIGKDAELRHTQNGDAVASFSVADSQGKDKETLWFDCSLWGKRADSLAPYLRKGTRVTVVGTLTMRAWTNKEGIEKTTPSVRVTDIALQGGGEQSEAPRQARQSAPARSAPAHDDGFDDDSEIPF